MFIKFLRLFKQIKLNTIIVLKKNVSNYQILYYKYLRYCVHSINDNTHIKVEELSSWSPEWIYLI